jgi:hypothetical protein
MKLDPEEQLSEEANRNCNRNAATRGSRTAGLSLGGRLWSTGYGITARMRPIAESRNAGRGSSLRSVTSSFAIEMFAFEGKVDCFFEHSRARRRAGRYRA